MTNDFVAGTCPFKTNRYPDHDDRSLHCNTSCQAYDDDKGACVFVEAAKSAKDGFGALAEIWEEMKKDKKEEDEYNANR